MRQRAKQAMYAEGRIRSKCHVPNTENMAMQDKSGECLGELNKLMEFIIQPRKFVCF